MDVLAMLKRRTGESDEEKLMDLMESAKAAIMSRRYPYGDMPDELETKYENLQFRLALAAYNKEGADFQTSHGENGISRTWGSEGFPQELLSEVIPICGVRS